MTAAVVVFPGSNCDQDVAWAFRQATGLTAELVWHEDLRGHPAPLWILPGGFSYGDYLRAGALAAVSPALGAIPAHLERGGAVLGICNGFQILVEAGLLPGAFQANTSLRFTSRDVTLRVDAATPPFLSDFEPGEVIDLPIAHQEGNYRLREEEARALLAAGRVAFRYAGPDGRAVPEANPNGSTLGIAGVLDATGRILGMMPHPERNAEAVFGSAAGGRIFREAARRLERGAIRA